MLVFVSLRYRVGGEMDEDKRLRGDIWAMTLCCGPAVEKAASDQVTPALPDRGTLHNRWWVH